MSVAAMDSRVVVAVAYQLIQSLGSTETGWASSNDQDIDIAVWIAVSGMEGQNIGQCWIVAYISSPVALVNCLLCPGVAMIAVVLLKSACFVADLEKDEWEEERGV